MHARHGRTGGIGQQGSRHTLRAPTAHPQGKPWPDSQAHSLASCTSETWFLAWHTLRLRYSDLEKLAV